MGKSLHMYADDYDSFGPVDPPHNAGDTRQRWSGNGVWGVVTWPPGAGTINYPLGIATAVEAGYGVREFLFCPGLDPRQVAPSNSWTEDPKYYGVPYSTSIGGDGGVPWSAWGPGNWYLRGSYAYRCGDWTTQTTVQRDISQLRINHPEFGERSLLVERQFYNHAEASPASNVLWGDTSVSHWKDSLLPLYVTYGSTPIFPIPGGNMNHVFNAKLMYWADQDAPH